MKLTLNINYRTNWGESVYITGDIPALGSGDYAKAPKLTVKGSSDWSVSLEIPKSVKEFSYRYFVRDEEGRVKNEWGHSNKLNVGKADSITIYDRWQDQPFDKPYYSSAFIDCICGHDNRQPAVLPAKGMLTFGVSAPMVSADRYVAVSGEGEALGNWDPAKAVRMSDAEFPLWKVNVVANGVGAGTQYKFLLIDAESGKPDGQILCYPVIKLLGKGVAHLGSGKNLLDDKQAEMGEALSPDLIADETAPKAFIWHTFNDGAVNVINSLDYAKRLRQMNVPVEMHIYPEGPHGLGLAPAYPHVADWAQRLIQWLKFNENCI